MTRHMAWSESSCWLADRTVARSCSKPRKLASGRARERPGQTPAVLTYSSTPPPSCPTVAAPITRTQTPNSRLPLPQAGEIDEALDRGSEDVSVAARRPGGGQGCGEMGV